MLARSREEVMADRIHFWEDIKTHAARLDLMNYILDNRCSTMQDFMNCLLSDMRGGGSSDWYDRFFSDDTFRLDVERYCERYGNGLLRTDIGTVMRSKDNRRRLAARRAARQARQSAWKKMLL